MHGHRIYVSYKTLQKSSARGLRDICKFENKKICTSEMNIFYRKVFFDGNLKNRWKPLISIRLEKNPHTSNIKQKEYE